MTGTIRTIFAGLALLAATGVVLSGCGNEAQDQEQTAKPADGADTQAITNTEPSHGGWWCVEHGMPEDVCTRCSTNLATDFQKKGDWCKEHDRPESQCFLCHPELEAKFAAQYEAKTGHKPPKPEEG